MTIQRDRRCPAVSFICLVDHDRVFLRTSDAPTAMEAYALTCTPDLFRSLRTFATLVQTCTVRCMLGESSNVGGAYNCHWLGVRRTCWAPHPRRACLTCLYSCRYSCSVFSERRPPQTQWRLKSRQRNGRSERVWDDDVCTAARSFVPFLFPSTEVMRLDILEAGLCIVC